MNIFFKTNEAREKMAEEFARMKRNSGRAMPQNYDPYQQALKYLPPVANPEDHNDPDAHFVEDRRRGFSAIQTQRINTHDCRDCAMKHLASAAVIAGEILNGYEETDHEMFLLGNLNEASEQLAGILPDLSLRIRNLRIEMFPSGGKLKIMSAHLEKMKAFYRELRDGKSVFPRTLSDSVRLQSKSLPFSVITPTGDRPQTLYLLRKYLERQTIQPAEWIVVDDGKTSSEAVLDGQPVRYLRREPGENESGHTLKYNLTAALELATTNYLIMMEDDDWYHPEYLETMLAGLKEHDLFGLGETVFYNFPGRRWRKITSRKNAPLCITGFNKKAIPQVIDACNKTRKWKVDIGLWNWFEGSKGYSDRGTLFHIGLKGLNSSRPGLTRDHRDSTRLNQADPELKFLKEHLGSDLDYYLNLDRKIDVVIPLGTGSKWGNNELRYALRSMGKYFLSLGKIYVVSETLPEWVTNVTFLEQGDLLPKNKDGNIINKILRACNEAELSDNFLFWSDDQVLVKPLLGCELGPVANRGNIASYSGSRWRDRMKRTAEILKSRGHSQHHFDSHVPQLLDKQKFQEVMQSYDYESDIGFCINTLYFNSIGAEPQSYQDEVKASVENKCCGGVARKITGKTWLGYNDRGLENGVKEFLESCFPLQSQYEMEGA